MSPLPSSRIALHLLSLLVMISRITAQTPVGEHLLSPADTTYFQQFGWTVDQRDHGGIVPLAGQLEKDTRWRATATAGPAQRG